MKKNNRLEDIQSFMTAKNFAVVGLSRNAKAFANMAYDEMKKRGKVVYGVSMTATEHKGDALYKSVADLPVQVEAAVVITKKEHTPEVIRRIFHAGIRKVWIQQSCDTPEAISFCRDNGMLAVWGHCIMMFNEPVSSVHSFHRWLMRTFGGYPKSGNA